MSGQAPGVISNLLGDRGTDSAYVMSMARVLTVIGARPQFVKAAVVSRALVAKGVEERIIHTGQHYDESMSDVFFREMGIPAPAHHLGVGSGPHGQQTGAMLSGIERILLDEKPDWLLVYGDTNSTLAGATASAKVHVPIAHVEAGLRSFNRRMPEEVNRVVTDHLSTLLLCPTDAAMANLHKEGIVTAPDWQGFQRSVKLVGDVMYDATLAFGEIAVKASKVLEYLRLSPGEFDLVTIHRAENTDEPNNIETITKALMRLARCRPIVWPLHPRTRKALETRSDFGRLSSSGIVLMDPVGYLDMLMLERSARCVITDSGGVQKEAFFAGVPCVTLREQTEWVELVDMGWNSLAPPSAGADAIVEAVQGARTGTTHQMPYGRGDASMLIAAELQ
jgi:UDP-GlcNAc3NAcA epimerase